MSDEVLFYGVAVLSFLLFSISILFSWCRSKNNRKRLDSMEKRILSTEQSASRNMENLCNCAHGIGEVKDQIHGVHARLIQRAVDNVSVKVNGGNVNTGQQVVKNEK